MLFHSAAVLVLFLHNQLEFSENTSTAIYHGFIVLCYLLPLLGAVISDSCLGKYKLVLLFAPYVGGGRTFVIRVRIFRNMVNVKSSAVHAQLLHVNVKILL